jgi:hypothetical protein
MEGGYLELGSRTVPKESSLPFEETQYDSSYIFDHSN